MRQPAHILAAAICAAALLALTGGGAEAQRLATPSSGMDWESGQFRPLSHSSVRSSRTPRNRTTRASRRGEADTSYGSLRLASLTGSSSVGPRPRNWCGWWMRTQLGGGPEFNLAWNWRRYGSPASPQVGAVVVWRSHVGMIVGEAGNGRWLVRSGNWGGRVATVARSVRGAIVRI